MSLLSPADIEIPQLSLRDPRLALLSKQQVDAFIFDLDGTLLDSLDAWKNSAVNYLYSRGIKPYSGLQEEMEQLSLLDGARILKERYQLKESPEELLNATLRPIGERYYRDIPAKTDVPLLLAYLHKQGIKMAVATASHADFARGALKRLGLLDYFEFIITCDEVGVGKRSPLVYEVAAKRLGTEKARTVVVEDALYALKTAHDAGFKTIGVADKHSLDDLPQIQQTADMFLNLE
ncbi:MAG: HAD family phosphatase [Elusimicrobiaceae bacterium]|nr:HAD family phosphatase [Elusimicrobiaceae bacterium]